MQKIVYLIITPRQSGNSYYPRYSVDLRLNATKPKLAAKEIAVQLTLEIPTVLFKRPDINAVLDIPADIITEPDQELILEVTAQKVAEGLHLDATEVRDGLAELLKKQENSRENNNI